MSIFAPWSLLVEASFVGPSEALVDIPSTLRSGHHRLVVVLMTVLLTRELCRIVSPLASLCSFAAPRLYLASYKTNVKAREEGTAALLVSGSPLEQQPMGSSGVLKQRQERPWHRVTGWRV